MKHFLPFLFLSTLLLTATPLHAVDGIPTSVVRSYIMLQNGQSIRYEQDWEQLIAYLNEAKLQSLLTDEDFKNFLDPAKMRLIPPPIRLTLLQWQFQRQLFQFDWMATESMLFAISAYAETAEDPAFQKWANSRIALIYWLRGDEKYAKIYSGFTNEYKGSDEPWFSLFEKAIAGENTPYTWLKGLLVAKKLDEGLDFVVIPTGEWITAAAMMQQRVAYAETQQKGEAAFSAINKMLPQAEMENLAPYLVQLSEGFNWNLGSILAPNNAALQASRNWVHGFKVKQTEWQIIESEQKAMLAKTSNSGYFWPFSLPVSIALGIGVVLIIVLSFRRKSRGNLSEPSSNQEMPSTAVEPSINRNREENRGREENPAQSIPDEKGEATEDLRTSSAKAKTILRPATSIVEAHQKSQKSITVSNRYQASPKVVADTVLNVAADKKKAAEKNEPQPIVEKKEYDSIGSQKNMADLTTIKPKVAEKDLAELSSRFIETLDEAKEQAGFEQLWEMVDRFIDKEYPNWKRLIEAADYSFSDKEFKYLSMMMVGIDNDRIAEYAGIQKASLRGARSRIRKKIGIEGEAEPHTWILERAKK